MKVLLCGYNWIGCSVLDKLLLEGHEVYVYTHDNPTYVNSLVDLCKKHSVNYTTDKISVNNIPFKPDIICSIYYRFIIPADVINLVNKKVFNLHPSLLPDYKGCSSITWALINGEKFIGYTYHYIDEKIDTGHIIIQNPFVVEHWDTQATLYHRIMFEASKRFLEAFYLVINEFKGIPQEKRGNYYKRGCPHNGHIDPNWSYDKIERFIRAMNYPPLPPASIGDQKIYTIEDYLKWKKNQ